MTMSLADIRLKQNPILTSLLIGMGQGTLIAHSLFPRLPQVLRGMTLMQTGDAIRRQYNLRRAPGSVTKRISFKFDGKTYTVDQYSVEVPIPRELISEADEMRKLNAGRYPDVSQLAMRTANDVLALNFEIEAGAVGTNPAIYGGNALALAGGTKWSASTGTPVTDLDAAKDQIRKATGRRPNTLILSADALSALRTNAQVMARLPSTYIGYPGIEQLKTILEVPNIVVGDASWIDENDVVRDVWGNAAVLAYVPTIGAGGSADFSLAEPAFGFTSVMEGHPFSETPYYEPASKSWIYGATFERSVNLAKPGAGFLFTNVK